MDTEQQCIAFEGSRRIAAGSLVKVALAVKQVVDRRDPAAVLVFDSRTSRPIEFDLRGSAEEVRDRLARASSDSGSSKEIEARPGEARPGEARPGEARPGEARPGEARPGEGRPGKARRGPGRPKLGVVGREVTLLPRHWEWLGRQPGGASVTLRKLVDRARRANAASDRVREARESAYRFMSAIAGNQPGFEEATRALFAGQAEDFRRHTEAWPGDVMAHARQLAALTFEAEESPDA